ncbi:vacuolar cation-chloride cotransporter 1 [[Candida] jaroonii]|uniref:Vacuolar cation-chloride cotransporter 1 n=1 Tax=[Candida] jaroonii TaxID=467808 RepID=A0ACA9YGC7_9ASCO|nr:vacuolar cation-chloride cotransporter 1 [[Candida] jaroonii]
MSESSKLLNYDSQYNSIYPTPSIQPSQQGSVDSEEDEKLDTFDGVFIPTSLNIISILMFLRFGFIIGQLGIIGSFALLLLSYIINSLTVMSISAIATNGTVKGGGTYYMISRTLGPEFGGSIGLIFFIGQILNSSLNVVGFVEPLLVNFGKNGDLFKVLPVSYYWQVLYSTILLAICTCISMVGANLVSKTALWLFITLTIAIVSIPISSLVHKTYFLDVPYNVGISLSVFKENLWPNFTQGAAGSVLEGPETFRDLFGIFFPATAGIFAGASMSGSLKNPSKSIPLGTIRGLFLTFVLYAVVIISIGVSIPRHLLYKDIKVIQSVNLQGYIIILGEMSTALFSVIMGIVGAANLLVAIADDRIIPGLSFLSMNKKTPSQKKMVGVYSILVTWFLAQIFLFADINQIAVFVTMAFLMTFIITNLACFLLKIGSAPNFRPKFKYFNSQTALAGVISAVIAMFIVDGMSASMVIIVLFSLIMVIHYTTPPSKFGDISQLLIYHQVRKYLLRLKVNVNVKYWRPQILLLVDNPRTSWNLIGFCNHLKKGGLYILGHVVILNDDTTSKSVHETDSEFSMQAYKEVQKQRKAWVKLRNMSNVKAFVQIGLGPTLPWGVRNVYLGSGLGGMKPNITVIGFYDFVKHGLNLPLSSFKSKSSQFQKLPTDDCRQEQQVSISQWVQVIEDLIIMQSSVAVAGNFNSLNLPAFDEGKHHWWSQPETSGPQKYIDLYPIQMSNFNVIDGKSVLSTNFDTYTLILQLGSILSTVPEWKATHKLRIIVFVEHESEIEDEKSRVNNLLSTLRIDAEIKPVCLDSGLLNAYNYIVKGYNKTSTNKLDYDKIDKVLRTEQWWKNLQSTRDTLKELEKSKLRKKNVSINPELMPLGLNRSMTVKSNEERTRRRRDTISNLHDKGLSLSFNLKGGLMPKDIDSSSDSETEDEVLDSSLDLDASQENLVIPEPRPQPSIASIRDKKRLMVDSDQISVKSSRSNLKPNFMSVKTPQAQLVPDNDDEVVNEDDDDDDDAKPSITFIDDEYLSTPNEKAEDDYFSLPVDKKKKLKNQRSALSSPSIITNDDGIIHQLRTPKFLADDGEGEVPSLNSSSINLPALRKSSQANQRSGVYKKPSVPPTTEEISPKQLAEQLKDLSFDEIPAKGQHLILNELMKLHSPKETTDVILSTLPAPSLNTHLDNDESFDYVNNLAIWLDDLVPTILFNSQTVTVTTEL